jgi:hypothetical protein
MMVRHKSSSSILSSDEMPAQRSLPSLSTASLAVIAIRLRVAFDSLIGVSSHLDSDRAILPLQQRHEQEAAMSVTERNVVPCEDDREFLVECWKECLVKMIADVEETKRRWQDASQTVKAESLAAVADARAAFSDTLIRLERAIEERLVRLRQLIDEKNGPRVQPYTGGKVYYEGQWVTWEGSTFRARCDTGRAPPDEEHWACVAAAGLDGLSFRVRGTYQPGEPYSRLDVVALNGGSFVARRNHPGECPGDHWQALCFQGKRGAVGPKGDRGERGPHGSSIATCELEPERYTLILNHSDGTSVCINLRPFFEAYHAECNG